MQQGFDWEIAPRCKEDLAAVIEANQCNPSPLLYGTAHNMPQASCNGRGGPDM